MRMNQKTRDNLLGALAASILWLAFLHLVNVFSPPETPAPVNVSVPATPAPELKKTPQKAVKLNAPVRVYTGGAALKNGLKLPPSAIQNQAVEVIAASKVPADDHPHTVTSTLDIETGEIETYTRRDPLPWLAFKQRTEAGIYAGVKNGDPTARLQLRHEVAQVKALHFGGMATVDQPLGGPGETDYFAGVGVWANW